MPADPSFLAQAASAVNVQQAQEQQQQRSTFARAMTMMGIGRKQKKIKQLKKEVEHWTEEREANEHKKTTCMVLMILALGDDVIDVVGALISLGILPSLTFPIPGMIRAMVAVHERTPKPDRLIRTIGAMAI
ncbi:MAG: hypothetical protein AAB855_04755, partial [Patescibacteria group bacterium]